MFIAGICIIAFSLPIVITLFNILMEMKTYPGQYYQSTVDMVIALTVVFCLLIVVGIVLAAVGYKTRNSKKRRTTIEINYTNPNIQDKICRLLENRGYKSVSYHNGHNETVWKCGIGFLTAIKYIKVEYLDGNRMSVSGWIRPVGGKEQNLDGFVCIVPKKQVTGVIEEIRSAAG